MLIEIDIREVIIDGERHYRGAERETTRPVDPSIVGDLPGKSPTNPSGLGERFPGIWKAIQRWYPEITVEPVLSPQGEPASDEPLSRTWYFRGRGGVEVKVHDVSDRNGGTVL